MAELFAGGAVIFWGVLLVLGVLVPFSIYAAQKWAYRCYKELIKTNQKLDLIINVLGERNTDNM